MTDVTLDTNDILGSLLNIVLQDEVARFGFGVAVAFYLLRKFDKTPDGVNDVDDVGEALSNIATDIERIMQAYEQVKNRSEK